jgi:hypothetical protein
MKLSYFLSYGILLISKTKQSPEKTGGIALLEWRPQIPIVHFSFRDSLKRGPVVLGKDFFDELGRNAAALKFLPKRRWAAVFAP